jgi:hypothetical protein
MPRQNRVTPYGDLVAVPDRGMFWGNRGQLLDARGELARFSRGRLWLICVLEFKGRRRTQWQPGRLTELYFLDEATGLAAGHRPCGECRHDRYQAYKWAWGTVWPGEPANAAAMDARLHADRLAGPGVRRTYRAPLAGLPDGAMAELDGRPWLVLGPSLLAWGHGGYTERRDRPAASHSSTREVTVLTPRATVAVLAAGYRPVLHPTAAGAHPGPP